MAKQEVKRCRTLIKFAVQSTSYTAGTGSTTTWETIKVRVGTNPDGTPILTDCFYAEWLGSYGTVAIQQQAEGVIRPARVRLPFVQCVYDALTTSDVRIYKGGKTDAANVFVLASAADDINDAKKVLEFNVKQRGSK